MKNFKPLAVFAATGFAASALAQYSSPELLMVTDRGGTLANGTVVPAQIERYDPYTGAYLGAFGAGYVKDPLGIAIVGQDAYVTDPFTANGTSYTRIDKFNFSTGAYDGSIFNSSPYNLYGLTPYGTNLLACDFGYGGLYSGVYTFTSAGQMSGFYALPNNSQPISMAADSSHDYIATFGGPGLYSYNLGTTGLVTSLNFIGGANNAYLGVADYSALGAVFAAGEQSSTGKGIVDEFSTGGSLVSEYLDPNEVYTSAALGHNGLLYLCDGGVDNSIIRFDGTVPISFGPIGSFKMADTAYGQRIAVYAAPEPLSMAFLALGAVGLIARKRCK